jgi:hypothetical protein
MVLWLMRVRDRPAPTSLFEILRPHSATMLQPRCASRRSGVAALALRHQHPVAAHLDHPGVPAPCSWSNSVTEAHSNRECPDPVTHRDARAGTCVVLSGAARYQGIVYLSA